MSIGAQYYLRQLGVLLLVGLSLRAAPDKPSGNSQKTPASSQVATVQPVPAPDVQPGKTRSSSKATPVAHPGPRPRLSEQTRAEIVAQLPSWAPPAAVRPKPPPPAAEAGGEVVRMKPVIVRGYQLPRTDNLEWLTKTAQDTKLVHDYLSSFDSGFLNRFVLPIVGVSPEARARQMYEEDKRLRDLRWMNDQISGLEKADPAAARQLKEVRDDLFTRPWP